MTPAASMRLKRRPSGHCAARGDGSTARSRTFEGRFGRSMCNPDARVQMSFA